MPIEMWVWILAQPIPWLLARHVVDIEVSTRNAHKIVMLCRFDIVELLSYKTRLIVKFAPGTILSGRNASSVVALLEPTSFLLSFSLTTFTCTRKLCFQLQE